MSWLSSLFAGFFQSFFGWLETWRKDKQRVEAEKSSAVSSAKDDADDIIGEIADDRSKVSQLDDADLIAKRLRDRKSGNADS